MKLSRNAFLILFIYIIAAILFWIFTLQKQSEILSNVQIELLNERKENYSEEVFQKEYDMILVEKNRRTLQYVGEGVVLFIMILIAGYIVKLSVNRSNKLKEMQNNFMMSITHELKSPIAGIKLNVQTLKRPNIDEEMKETLINRTLKETERLNDLCSNLLLATQLEGKKAAYNIQLIDFSHLCMETVLDFQYRSNHYIKFQVEDDLYTKGDRVMWKIVLSNLIENAIKYSPHKTSIFIKAMPNENDIIFTIADNGPGVEDSEKNKIFNKFYRVGNENNRITKGTGLGLYLTSEIIKLQNANISVYDNQPNGTVFEIKLERAIPDSLEEQSIA